MKPRASIIIPTHNRPDTLEVAVASVLAQTVTELEVLLLGDGITDAVRARARQLEAQDPRVRLLDFPKGANHGEAYRHDAVLAARSDAIFYLCDDDLFLPDHVADLLDLLESANFVQCLNGYFTADGALRFQYGDLADPDTIELILSDGDLRFNSAAVTGTAHSREFYLRAGVPWESTPAGWWPDHYQWRKLMRHPDFRGATSARMTILQFPATLSERSGWSPERLLAELQSWSQEIERPDAQLRIDDLVRTAIGKQLRDDLRALDVAWVREEGVRTELQEVRKELEMMRSTVSWRITGPLRKVRRLLSRK